VTAPVPAGPPAAAPAAPADAIAAYDDLLAGGAGEQLAADTQGELEAGLARRGLVFGDRALCTVLRPRLLTERQYRALAARVARLSRALARAHEAAAADPALRAQFRLEGGRRRCWAPARARRCRAPRPASTRSWSTRRATAAPSRSPR
jgi:hypothetical protein